jgi:hypothetical protein
MPEQENKLEQLSESGICGHGNFPDSCDACKSTDIQEKAEDDKDSTGDEQKSKDDNWTEYLKKTGNPMLDNMQKNAGKESELLSQTSDPKEQRKAQVDIHTNDEEADNLAKEIHLDLKTSSRINKEVTGDVNKDAVSFFENVEAHSFVERLNKGENPEALLQEFRKGMEAIIQNAKTNPEARRRAYTAIQAREHVDRILGQGNK